MPDNACRSTGRVVPHTPANGALETEQRARATLLYAAHRQLYGLASEIKQNVLESKSTGDEVTIDGTCMRILECGMSTTVTDPVTNDKESHRNVCFYLSATAAIRCVYVCLCVCI